MKGNTVSPKKLMHSSGLINQYLKFSPPHQCHFASRVRVAEGKERGKWQWGMHSLTQHRAPDQSPTWKIFKERYLSFQVSIHQFHHLMPLPTQFAILYLLPSSLQALQRALWHCGLFTYYPIPNKQQFHIQKGTTLYCSELAARVLTEHFGLNNRGQIFIFLIFPRWTCLEFKDSWKKNWAYTFVISQVQCC